MKKIMLLAICCLTYVSVQAQNVTAEQIKQKVETQVEAITSKVDFSDSQKEYLIEYLTYTAKEKAGNFEADLKANPLKDVNTDTFFTKDQFTLIKNTISQKVTSQLPGLPEVSSKTSF